MLRDPDYSLKIVIVGDSKVGKSQIFNQYVYNNYIIHPGLATSCEHASRHQTIKNNVLINIHFWAVTGQEHLRDPSQQYLKQAVGAPIVYDITNYESFKNVKICLKEIRDHAEPYVRIILIGNKSDLWELREVKSEEAMEYAHSEDIRFMEASARDNYNIEEMFTILLNEAYDRVMLSKTKANHIYKLGSRYKERSKCY